MLTVVVSSLLNVNGCCVCIIECERLLGLHYRVLRLLGLHYRVLTVVGSALSSVTVVVSALLNVNGCCVCIIES